MQKGYKKKPKSQAGSWAAKEAEAFFEFMRTGNDFVDSHVRQLFTVFEQRTQRDRFVFEKILNILLEIHSILGNNPPPPGWKKEFEIKWWRFIAKRQMKLSSNRHELTAFALRCGSTDGFSNDLSFAQPPFNLGSEGGD